MLPLQLIAWSAHEWQISVIFFNTIYKVSGVLLVDLLMLKIYIATVHKWAYVFSRREEKQCLE